MIAIRSPSAPRATFPPAARVETGCISYGNAGSTAAAAFLGRGGHAPAMGSGRKIPCRDRGARGAELARGRHQLAGELWRLTAYGVSELLVSPPVTARLPCPAAQGRGGRVARARGRRRRAGRAGVAALRASARR